MCGIVGLFSLGKNINISKDLYQALNTLQHRGQDSAGLATWNIKDKKFLLHKAKGTVDQGLFPQIKYMNGEMGIGHTRYSTIGTPDNFLEIQPHVKSITLTNPFSNEKESYQTAMAHNGNLVNYFQLKETFETEDKVTFESGNDLEILHHLFNRKLSQMSEITFHGVKSAVKEVFHYAKGAYSVVGIIGTKGMYAFRDPNGIRPLSLGIKNSTDENGNERKDFIFASESKTLSFLGIEKVKDLSPGELIFITETGSVESQIIENQKFSPCMFEWVYFSGAESELEGAEVYDVRLKLGNSLANSIRHLIEDQIIKPDLVAPIPDTGRTSAITLAESLKLPYREVLLKNRYVQRSFILSKEERKKAIHFKFTPVINQVKGKNILLVDDSIVRGVTTKKIVELLKNSGANEVYLASTCPPLIHPCFYGIDFPNHEELVAFNRPLEEIEKKLGADKIIYTTTNDLKEAINLPSLCTACLDGKYPTPVDTASLFQKLRNK